MSKTIQDAEELFEAGPPLGWQKALNLTHPPTDLCVKRRVLGAAVIGWVPLAVFAIVTDLASGTPTMVSFFSDIAVHVRYLVAVPLLILAESDAICRFGRVASSFMTSGIVEKDRERYDAAVTSTRRILGSKVNEVAAFLLAYVFAFLFVRAMQSQAHPVWHWTSADPAGLSPAGLWHAFVSLPLFLLLSFGCLWRLLVWWRFLGLMARLDLHLVPSHPDRTGGLKFVGTSLQGYRFLALAIGSVAAGAEMSAIVRTGQPLWGFPHAPIGVLAVVLTLSMGPLVMFSPKLRATKRQASATHGGLCRNLGMEFQGKWLNESTKLNPSSLETNDFSAMADLYQVVNNVYRMQQVPFSWPYVYYLAGSAVLPFIPVALLILPVAQIVQGFARLLL